LCPTRLPLYGKLYHFFPLSQKQNLSFFKKNGLL
jgi:hypothetical protein